MTSSEMRREHDCARNKGKQMNNVDISAALTEAIERQSWMVTEGYKEKSLSPEACQWVASHLIETRDALDPDAIVVTPVQTTKSTSTTVVKSAEPVKAASAGEVIWGDVSGDFTKA